MGTGLELLPMIAAGASAASGVMGLIGGMQQSKAAKQQAAYNAQIEANRAKVLKDQQTRDLYKAQGTARTQAAGSGATLGSFEDVLNANQEQGLLDIALGEYDSKIQQDRIRYEGAVASSQAKSNAVSSLLSGAAGAASGYTDYKQGIKLEKALSATSKAAGK